MSHFNLDIRICQWYDNHNNYPDEGESAMKNMPLRLTSHACWTALCFCSGMVVGGELALHAQQNVGRLLGVVRDPVGAVVPDASIAVQSVRTGVETRLKTNSRSA